MQPTVSIVIPFYNLERDDWFNEAMDSVINQTFEDFEIIIVNDFSDTPKAVAILNSLNRNIEMYRKKGLVIKVVSHDSNLGLSQARNTGAVHGSFILFLLKKEYKRK